MSFLDTFKKQGGWQLVKQYWREGVLFYAFRQLLLTGTSKKALEILRLGVALKLQKKLKRKFSKTMDEFDAVYSEINYPKAKGDKIWVCWMQGIENAPALVQKCFAQLKKNITDREIVLITSDNIDQYVTFPNYITEKYKKGIISQAHFSDLLRVELLCKYGGTWIDSTVFCPSNNVPSYMLDSDLFFFQKLKPGSNGSVYTVSNWFLSSSKNNRIMLALRNLLLKYWEKYDYAIDYFFFHQFMAILINRYNDEIHKIYQYPNSLPHVLLLMLFEPFDKQKYDELIKICPFHKLTYKSSEEDRTKKDTYYQYVMNNY